MATLLDYASIKATHHCLAELEGAGIAVRRKNAHEAESPCPWCGGNDRFVIFIADNRFWCRQCKKWGDVVDLRAQLTRGSIAGAAKELAGMEATTIVRPPEKTAWNEEEARIKANFSHFAITQDGNPGTPYMLGRGFNRATIDAFGFGVNSDCNGQWGIVMPWYNSDEDSPHEIVGLKYRMLNPTGSKCESMPGSSYKGQLYGTENLDDRNRIVVVCEGELNAASIWQVAHEWINVVSIGSEGQKLTNENKTLIAQHPVAIAWMDKPSVAKAMAQEIGGSYYASERNGQKMDANDHLKDGTLQRLLIALCLVDGRQQKELKSDLARATLDAESAALCQRRALWA